MAEPVIDREPVTVAGRGEATVPPMRTRLLVVLLALVVMTVVPPESVLAESVGSVVGQVASCVEPGAVLRDIGTRDEATDCADGFAPRSVPPLLVAALLVLLAALVARPARARRGHAWLSASRWRLADAASGAVAPWRAPPSPV
jgi:hypothetical protein